MDEGKQLIITGEVMDKRKFNTDDGSTMYCVTIAGFGFKHDQYMNSESFAMAPPIGEPIVVFGEPKANGKGVVTIKMNECKIGQADPVGKTKRSKVA